MKEHLEIMKRLRENVKKKNQNVGKMVLGYCITKMLRSIILLIHQILAKNQIRVVPLLTSPGSMGLFFVFKLKSTLKECRFQSIDNIKPNKKTDLKILPLMLNMNLFKSEKKDGSGILLLREIIFNVIMCI